MSVSAGMMLGGGKYGYLGAWLRNDTDGDYVAFRSLLHVRYADGTAQVLGSKAASWRAREGPVRTADYCEPRIVFVAII